VHARARERQRAIWQLLGRTLRLLLARRHQVVPRGGRPALDLQQRTGAAEQVLRGVAEHGELHRIGGAACELRRGHKGPRRKHREPRRAHAYDYVRSAGRRSFGRKHGTQFA